MKERLGRLEKDVREKLEGDLAPAEAQRDAVDDLNELEETREQLLRENAATRFIQEYVQEAAEALADGERDEPLCRCSLPAPACPLKAGRLPGEVTRADTLDAGIDRHLAHHPEAVVLTDARKAWSALVAEYRSGLRSVKHQLQKGEQQTRGVLADTDD